MSAISPTEASPSRTLYTGKDLPDGNQAPPAAPPGAGPAAVTPEAAPKPAESAPASPPPPPPAPAEPPENPLGESGGGTEEPSGEPATEPTPAELAERASAYELKLPDGMTVDEPAMNSFRELAAKANLPQEDAQGLINLYAENFKLAAEGLATAQKTAWDTTLAGWKETWSKDPLIGGANMDTAKRTVGKAMDQFGSKEAREAFDLTGAGQNPAVIKFIYNMAKALSEGKPVLPGNPTPPSGRRNRSLYNHET